MAVPEDVKTPDRIRTHRDTLATEAKTILSRSTGGTLSDADRTRFEEITADLEELKTRETSHNEGVDRLLDLIRNGGGMREGEGSGVNDAGSNGRSAYNSGDKVRDEARRTIDRAHTAGEIPDYAAERATRLVETGKPEERGLAARWATATGNPAYLRAFAGWLADPIRGHMMWTAEEQAAYRDVAMVRTAMSTGTGAGAEMLPLQLDPAIMLNSAGSNNPIRQLARVVQATSNKWVGVSSAGATAEWKTENAQAADGSPALGDEVVDVWLGDVDVIYSYEVGQDALNFLPELQRIMLDAADQLQATAFTTGSGVAQPQGVVTGLAGTASEINSTGSEALIAADVFALQNALPARFSANASWQMHIATINTLAQLETTNGSLKFPEIRDGKLLGKPLHENSNMDGTVNAAVTASNFLIVYGDMKQSMVIADRIGATLEILPGYGANGRPSAQRHAFMTFRTGSTVVVPNGARLLDVPTAA